MRYSRQRELILRTIQTHEDICFMASELYNGLKKEVPSLSLGTVYRNLNQMTEAGVLQRISIGGLPDHYGLEVKAPAYFVCRNCGRVFRLQNLELPLNLQGQSFLPARMEDYELTVKGLCGNCVEAEIPQKEKQA